MGTTLSEPVPHVPTCFIGYCWGTSEHNQWVLMLAQELRNNHVETRLDQLDAKAGVDLPSFMENAIVRSDHVLIICTPDYARRANEGEGGVGYEKRIITGLIFTKHADPGKFIPILRSGCSDDAIPTYLLGRKYVDFTDDHAFAANLEELLHVLLNGSLHPGPQFKTPPPLDAEPDSVSTPSSPEPAHERRSASAPLVRVGAAPENAVANDQLRESIPLPSTSPRLLTRRNRSNHLLTGANDTCLVHTTGFFGRSSEVATVLQFLREASTPCVATVPSAPKMLIVTGTPGIGKSEVCKEALRQSLHDQPSARVYYVELVDVHEETSMLACLASAFDVPEATRDKVYPAVAAQPCLLYLDNLEDVLCDSEARSALEELVALPGVSVLASSREHVAQFGRDLPILRLDPDAAIGLFVDEWKRSEPHPSLTGTPELPGFVTKDLDCHALSIVLVAAQAYQVASLGELVERWRNEKTRLARLPYARDRLTSLDVSLERSLASVRSRSTNAVTLWGLCALFPEGMSPAAFDVVTKAFAGDRFQAREVLLRLNIIRFPHSDDELGNEVLGSGANKMATLMLAPLRGFILEKAKEGAAGLRIDRLLDTTIAYFFGLAMAAKQTELGDDGTTHGKALDQLLPELPNLREAVMLAARRGTQWAKSLGTLSRVLSNSYQFRPLVSIDILHVLLLRQQQALRTADTAHTLLFLGNLEDKLGYVDPARQHYTQAIELYTKEQDNIGLGNALSSLGELEFGRGELDPARQHYTEAIELYTKGQDNIGLGNTLTSLSSLEKYLGELDPARQHYTQAIELYTKEQDNIGLGNALRGLGNLESLLGERDRARQHYAQAMELYTKGQIDKGIADTSRSFGDLERELGEMDSARRHYTQAIELYTKEQSNIGLTNAVRGLGDLDARLGEMDSARRHYTRSMELATKEHFDLGVANALRGLGDLELTLDQFQQAHAHYAKARELYIAEREMIGLGHTCAELARVAHALNQPEQADLCLDEGMRAAQASNVPSVVQYVVRAKTEVYLDATKHDGESRA